MLLTMVSAGGLTAAPITKPAADVNPNTSDAPAVTEETKPEPEAEKEKPEDAADKATDEKETDPDDEMAAEQADAEAAAVARPVSAEPVQIFGWREYIRIDGVEEQLKAKLDTGARTSSIHAEDIELFERDGKKWVRFILTDPSVKKPARTRIEAPFVRIAKIKEPGGDSVPREVVRLSFEIGDRKLRGEFTLNNRSNMLAPVLIGRTMIKDLGWVDPSRAHLAEQKILR